LVPKAGSMKAELLGSDRTKSHWGFEVGGSSRDALKHARAGAQPIRRARRRAEVRTSRRNERALSFFQ